MVTERQKKIVVAGVLAISAAALAGLLIAIIPHHQSFMLSGALALMVLTGAFLAGVPRWRRLDHMQRDSRLDSWYWGGSFGGAAGLVLVLVFSGVRSPIFAGAASVWVLQFAGYATARLHWWLTHRSAAS